MPTTQPGLAANYVAGQWRSGDACEKLAITDPATGETLGAVPDSAPADVDRAVQAAVAAFPSWRRTRRGARPRAVPP